MEQLTCAIAQMKKISDVAIKRVMAAINGDGVVIDVEPYDCRPEGRKERVQAAADAITKRLGISRVIIPESRRAVMGDNDIEIVSLIGDIQVGMEEIGWGRWDFRDKQNELRNLPHIKNM